MEKPQAAFSISEVNGKATGGFFIIE